MTPFECSPNPPLERHDDHPAASLGRLADLLTVPVPFAVPPDESPSDEQ